jgi:hypothetical protein
VKGNWLAVGDGALGFWKAEDKDHARAVVKAFAAAYGVKFPKAAAMAAMTP